MPHYCLLGCRPRGTIPLHNFPNPKRFPDTFRAWVEIVGGKIESDDVKFYLSKKICDIHFEDKDRNRNNRLNCLAVPSLHLPNNCNLDHRDKAVEDDGFLQQPSTSIIYSIGNPDHNNEHIAPLPITVVQTPTTGGHRQLVVYEHNYWREVQENTKISLESGTRKKPPLVVCYREQRQIRILRRKIHKLKSESVDSRRRGWQMPKN